MRRSAVKIAGYSVVEVWSFVVRVWSEAGVIFTRLRLRLLFFFNFTPDT